MKPPPPMLPQHGSVTARAYPTATAASTALPPPLRISNPTSDALDCVVTTTPFLPDTTEGVLLLHPIAWELLHPSQLNIL